MELVTLTERLRERIVGGLHVGRLQGGDRLPGVRQVAKETGANPRTVAKAYRELEREGLVEMRPRSGVYLVKQSQWGGTLLEETGRWLGGILLEAWKRHIPIPELADLIRRCTRAAQLRAACIADTEDERRAVCDELEQRFGIVAVPVAASSLPGPEALPVASPGALRDVDLVVSTPFHAGRVRALAEAVDKPVVLATLHREVAVAIERRLQRGQLVVVCADPAFGARIRELYGGARPERIRVVEAEDSAEVEALRRAGEPVLLTRAAQERLQRAELSALVPFTPFLSVDSARQIAELMVRLHMEREHG